MTAPDPEAFNRTPFAEKILEIDRGERNWPEPDAKRHHFIPRFLLDRFANADGFISQLDKRTGSSRFVRPEKAASRLNFYRFENEEGERSTAIEGILGMAEDSAAPALASLEESGRFSDVDRASIATFLAYLNTRTPGAREETRAYDEQMRLAILASELASPKAFEEMLARGAEHDEDLRMSPERAEKQRQWMLEALKDGRIRVTDPDGGYTTDLLMEVAHEMAAQMYSGMTWVLMRTNGRPFVNSDRGVAAFDPDPPYPWSTPKLMSSSTVETYFPISSKYCLRLVPGPPTLEADTVGDAKVMEVNLRLYGWSESYIFGASQETVTSVRRESKSTKARFATTPPPPRYVTLLDRDPEDDSLAEAHAARGWPRYLVSREDGRPREVDYFVSGSDGTSVEIGLLVSQVVEERARKRGGFAADGEMPGRLGYKVLAPGSVNLGRRTNE